MKAHTCASKIAIAGLVKTILVEVRAMGDGVAVLANALEVLKIAWVDTCLIDEAFLGDLATTVSLPYCARSSHLPRI
jgi:hypothetical protein